MPNRAETTLNIGKSVLIKGELSVDEDVMVEGRVEGTIHLHNHVLTIGPGGRIDAQVFAKSVIVFGAATGTITATDKIDIRDHGSVEGDVISPCLRIAEGAHFCGFVEMPQPRRSTASSNDGTNPSGWFGPDRIPVDVSLPADPMRSSNGSSKMSLPPP